ncbi:MAG: hypothetical protein ACRYHQ_04215 [Janthinobacterium lividum]
MIERLHRHLRLCLSSAGSNGGQDGRGSGVQPCCLNLGRTPIPAVDGLTGHRVGKPWMFPCAQVINQMASRVEAAALRRVQQARRLAPDPVHGAIESMLVEQGGCDQGLRVGVRWLLDARRASVASMRLGRHVAKAATERLPPNSAGSAHAKLHRCHAAWHGTGDYSNNARPKII